MGKDTKRVTGIRCKPEEILIAANDRHLVIVGRDRWHPEHLHESAHPGAITIDVAGQTLNFFALIDVERGLTRMRRYVSMGVIGNAKNQALSQSLPGVGRQASNVNGVFKP